MQTKYSMKSAYKNILQRWRRKKCEKHFLGFFFTSCLSGSVVCCLSLSTCTVYIRRVCFCEIAGRWTSLIAMDEWRLLVCLFFSFFHTIFRFASLNSPTMSFARVNRLEGLYKCRCVMCLLRMFVLGFSFGRFAWRKSPADGMNQQGTTFFYCIPAQL
jgi:hypothetical protein